MCPRPVPLSVPATQSEAGGTFPIMTTTTKLIHARRFLPLFVTQLLGAFNDNLFKNTMILFVVYEVYHSEAQEARFSALASAIFIISSICGLRPPM